MSKNKAIAFPLRREIFIDDGVLSFTGSQIASVDEYMEADRCVGSVFEALNPGEQIELIEGIFILDKDLDPQEARLKWSIGGNHD